MSDIAINESARDYRVWSEEEDQQLVQHRSDGLSFNKIAERLDRTRQSCSNRLRKMGLLIRSSPWNDELEEEVKGLWAEHSAQEIAKILQQKHGSKINKSSVIGKLRRLGLTSANKITCHPNDSYAPQGVRSQVHRFRKPRKKYDVPRKPKLRIVANGGGGFRVETSVTGEIPVLRCAEVQSLNLSLADLPENGCRYIAGDDMLYCGLVQREKSSYCPKHHSLVWVAPQPHKPRYVGRAAA